MGEPHRGLLVDAPQNVSTGLGHLRAVVDGLAAAAGAAAGTGHDLHEIVVDPPLLQIGHQLPGVGEAADHRHGEVAHLRNGEGGLLPTLHATDGAEGIRVGIGAGDQIIGAAEGGVHHTAGGTEDHRRTGTGTQRTVEGSLLHGGGVDLLAPEHPHDLTGSQHNIHVGIVADGPHGGQGRLAFFCGAGHDGHYKDALGVHTDLLGKVALGQSAEHLLGTLGSGEIVGIIRELALQEPHPAGTAGGEHGPRVPLPMGKAVHELTALLHNGEVGGKIGIKHVVKAHLLQGGDHALRRGELRRQMVVLCPGHPDGGGHLHHGDLIGVGQSIEHLAGVIVLLQATHGTVGHALAAEGAVGLPQGAVLPHADGGVGAGTHQVPYVHPLHLIADLDAAHTADAAVLDPHHGVAEIRGDIPQILDVVLPQQIIIVGQLLKTAVSAAGTLGAADLMLAQKQPKIHPAGLPHTGRVGMDHHALGHHVVAGGDQALLTLHLHDAQAAGTDFVDLLEIAHGGDLDACGAGGLQNGGTLRHGNGPIVDGQCYHFSFRPPLKIP